MRRFLLALLPLSVLACGQEPVSTAPVQAPRAGLLVGQPICVWDQEERPPACYTGARGSKGGARLLLYAPGGAGLGYPWSDPLPAGIASCLGDGGAVVGCDDLLYPDSSYVIDYSADNSPGFAQLAARLTNGVNDGVGGFWVLLDASRKVMLEAGGWGWNEAGWTSQHLSGGIPAGGYVGPDFTGFTIAFVRHRVFNIDIHLESGMLVARYQEVWEIWGKNAHAAS